MPKAIPLGKAGVKVFTTPTLRGYEVVSQVEISSAHDGPCRRIAINIMRGGLALVIEGNDDWIYSFEPAPNEPEYNILGRFHRAEGEEDRRDRQYLNCKNDWVDLPASCFESDNYRNWRWPEDAFRVPFLPLCDQTSETEMLPARGQLWLVTEIFNQGRAAHALFVVSSCTGKVDSCPYPEGSSEREEWLAGWHQQRELCRKEMREEQERLREERGMS